MACQKCEDEDTQNYISVARKEAQEQGISGEEIVILRRVNKSLHWVRKDDQRIAERELVTRIWID